MKSWKDNLQEMEDEINLNKITKGYFNKTIFRVGFGVILILAAIVIYTEGWHTDALCVSCNSLQGCKNPFYYCHNNVTIYPPIMNCDQFNALDCKDNVCLKESIAKNEELGNCPGKWTKNFSTIALLVITTFTLINHFWWIFKKKEGEKLDSDINRTK